jgi:hypothetical protein
MTDWRIVAEQIKAFDDRRAVVKAMRTAIRRPLPDIRKAIKKRAVDTLPKRGGLGAWVASTRVSAAVKVNSRRVQMKLKGGRNSAGGRTDVDAIDRGRVRAPAWGRKGPGQWHSQKVPDRFFKGPAADAGGDVSDAIDDAVDTALQILRG